MCFLHFPLSRGSSLKNPQSKCLPVCSIPCLERLVASVLQMLPQHWCVQQALADLVGKHPDSSKKNWTHPSHTFKHQCGPWHNPSAPLRTFWSQLVKTPRFSIVFRIPSSFSEEDFTKPVKKRPFEKGLDHFCASCASDTLSSSSGPSPQADAQRMSGKWKHTLLS